VPTRIYTIDLSDDFVTPLDYLAIRMGIKRGQVLIKAVHLLEDVRNVIVGDPSGKTHLAI
jgi:hypothetical protein